VVDRNKRAFRIASPGSTVTRERPSYSSIGVGVPLAVESTTAASVTSRTPFRYRAEMASSSTSRGNRNRRWAVLLRSPLLVDAFGGDVRAPVVPREGHLLALEAGQFEGEDELAVLLVQFVVVAARVAGGATREVEPPRPGVRSVGRERHRGHRRPGSRYVRGS
jgi:hypothetical protein